MERKPQAAALRENTVLEGKWTLVELIGTGGTANVYRAQHHNGNKVAVKILFPHLLHNTSVCSRFEREARLANRVDHPGAVQVQDGGVTPDGCPFLVTELLQGETLESRREANAGVLPIEEVIWIGGELLAVLQSAHEQGVLHRDIKPSNLFRTSRGELKVLDFGLARESEASEGSTTSYDAVLGTVGFMAPEQAQGRWDIVDARTDIWATGATLLKLATGLDIHEGHTPQERLALAATRPVPPIAVRAPLLAASLVNVIEKATAYSMRERYTSATEMREALLAISVPAVQFPKGGSAEASLDVVPKRTRRSALALVVIVATVVAIAIGVRLARGRRATAQVLGQGPSLQGASSAMPEGSGIESRDSDIVVPVDSSRVVRSMDRPPIRLPAASISAAPNASASPVVVPSVNPLDRRH